ncbi:MAG TPA: hypothetical protein H9828_03460 [Candidatus Alistipes intestinigallinarum]|uniref:BIG2 domain-containing protein n=1 Tax=Candidatus Alistipes intestinigallinarum TaxID=2838440 RepID=A0A9D1Z2N5_9BACT|nr:hypothetical protein [Candidatus Alistipes intestinigallinarum]
MKHNYFRYGVLALLIAVGSASCSDDDTLVKPEPSPIVDPELPESPAIELGAELFDVKKGSTQSLEITSGAGEYQVNVLDPAIASASVEGNTITVEGLAYGVTDIVISDQGGSYKSILANVYLSDAITLSTSKIELTLAMGAAADGSFTIDAGNPPYSVASNSDETATATLAEDGTTVNVRGLQEGEATITVTDARGLTQQVSIVNTATDSPFSDEELETIKAAGVNTCVINDTQVTGGTYCGGSNDGYGKPVWGIWSFAGKGKELYVKTIDKQWIDMHEVKAYENMYIFYRDGSNGGIILDNLDAHAEVIKADGDTVWITFWTQKEDQLYKGYIVVRLDK